MKILLKYGRNVPKKYAGLWNERNATNIRLLKAVPQHVTNRYDTEYLCAITIGTSESQKNSQTFTVIPDTGSSTLWIPEKTAKIPNCPNIRKFDPSLSKTFVKKNYKLKELYGDGSTAEGYYGSDTISIGDSRELKISNQQFGLATSISLNNCELEGIFGLGFSNSLGIDSPLITAWKQNSLSQPIFTIWLSSENYYKDPNGLITYGGFDSEHCDSTITYHKLSSTLYWQFRIEGARINNKFYRFNAEAISDTGTSFLYVSQSLADELVANFGVIDKYCLLALGTLVDNGYAQFFILGDPFIRQFCQVHDMANERIGFARSL
uniref:Peptidase A1 domain-containing protein n=1 Tax=Syphacia muris TaxID=451379 RepID=A0A0N5AFP3_9BILA